MDKPLSQSPDRLMLRAFIDESGQPTLSLKASDHFVLSAIVIHQEDSSLIAHRQNELRKDLGRKSTDHLHWVNLRSHSERLHAAKQLADMPLSILSEILCKRRLTDTSLINKHGVYMYMVQQLIHKLTQFAHSRNTPLEFTLAQLGRFKLADLRALEQRIRIEQAQIDWSFLSPSGGMVNQPTRVEQLQLADIAASATFRAFEPDRFGNCEPRYLECLRPKVHRGSFTKESTTQLSIHPFDKSTKAAYPWVATL